MNKEQFLKLYEERKAKKASLLTLFESGINADVLRTMKEDVIVPLIEDNPECSEGISVITKVMHPKSMPNNANGESTDFVFMAGSPAFVIESMMMMMKHVLKFNPDFKSEIVRFAAKILIAKVFGSSRRDFYEQIENTSEVEIGFLKDYAGAKDEEYKRHMGIGDFDKILFNSLSVLCAGGANKLINGNKKPMVYDVDNNKDNFLSKEQVIEEITMNVLRLAKMNKVLPEEQEQEDQYEEFKLVQNALTEIAFRYFECNQENQDIVELFKK